MSSSAKRVGSRSCYRRVAAAEAFAGLWDCQGFRQQIEVDVGRASAIGARCDDGADAVQAHVGERHRLEAASKFILDFCDRDAFDPGVLDRPQREPLGRALNHASKMILVVLHRLV